LLRKPAAGSIGCGNGNKKSIRFTEFVLETRKTLKTQLGLCEETVKRILGYSNNFLHKKLKTEEVGQEAVNVSDG
jgi:hypothetical protein